MTVEAQPAYGSEAGNTDSGFGWYRSHGGKLTETTYASAVHVLPGSVISPVIQAQADRMTRLVSRTPSGRKRRYIDSASVGRMYHQLREPLHGECASWPDEKIFAEVLLANHHVAAHASFLKMFPHIFQRHSVHTP